MSFIQSKHHIRVHIAQEAARLIIEENIQDFLLAKQKAAARLRIHNKADLPTNEDIEAALSEYQQLYRSSTQADHLKQLREIAVEAMEFFQTYTPRLVGSVLEGYAGDHSSVVLYLFSDTAEEILIKLLDANIPYTETSHTITSIKPTSPKKITHKYPNNEYPAFHFILNDINIQLKLLPIQFKNQLAKELAQGSLKAVRKML